MTTKTKTAYFCQNCGAQFPKWQGQCTSCKEWNTLVEEVVEKPKDTGKGAWKSEIKANKAPKAVKIAEIDTTEQERIPTGNVEFDRVLGGGLAPGSVVLLGGEPGIGKSTLLLQVALDMPLRTLYVSGEESPGQIKVRAERLSIKNDNCYILAETKTQNIFRQLEKNRPELLVIDSVQTLYTNYIESSAGSVSQIKECAAELIGFAKETGVPVVLVGHITKEGNLAGPKILEHMVDTVLQFEGDRNHVYRILRAHKNRFGSTRELGIYEMYGDGLREVTNPSEVLLSGNEEKLSGTAVAATLEGMRPLLIEVQALVSPAVYGTPQRSATGYNLKRLNMILAVLEKRAGFRLGAKDVFLNITGGITIDDPAIDMAVVAAVLSSNEDIAVSADICFAAEVGLAGEIRAVPRVEQRIAEAEKLGFSTIVVSKSSKIPTQKSRIKIQKVGRIEDVAGFLMG